MISLNYRDSRPIYEQIKDGLKKLIVSGAMAADEKLPSVRALATQLTINPNTIQRAYRELELQGWVASVPGKGSYVSGVPLGMPSQEQKLTEEFDQIAQQLLSMGITREQLMERLSKGGNDHA